MQSSSLTPLFIVLTFVPAMALGQGSLTPPGAPAPTMKSLDQIEARIPLNSTTAPGDAGYQHLITQPGSYFLTEDMVVTKPNGIGIRAPGVTLDLGGFEVRAPMLGGNGIDLDSRAGRCTVKNGSIHRFAHGLIAATSVDADPSDFARGGLFYGITVDACSDTGIVGGAGWIIRDCSAAYCGRIGIAALSGSIIVRCASRRHLQVAILGLDGALIEACTADRNGVAGISVTAGARIAGCVASLNEQDGIQVSGSSMVQGSTASGNTQAGIEASTRSTVIGCSVTDNTSKAGITLNSYSTAKGNVCEENATGIRVDGEASFIDGNHLSDNVVGIDINQGGNLMVRNSVARSTDRNYDLAPGNRYGPVTNLAATDTAAVSGSSADDTTTTAHPWANFAH